MKRITAVSKFGDRFESDARTRAHGRASWTHSKSFAKESSFPHECCTEIVGEADSFPYSLSRNRNNGFNHFARSALECGESSHRFGKGRAPRLRRMSSDELGATASVQEEFRRDVFLTQKCPRNRATAPILY